MRQLFISLILVGFWGLSLTGQDRLYIENFRIMPGDTLQVPVLLLNDTAYSGLQTDLYLPTGLLLVVEDDEYVIDLTSRKDKSHTVVSHQLENGAIRIYVSSVSAREFSGNSGAIMTMSLTATNDLVEQSLIELKNSVCAEAIGTRHVLNNEICQVNYNLPGDVNGDKEVNIADVNAIIDIILGSSVDPETMFRADVNGDKEVNIADINMVLDIILSN